MELMSYIVIHCDTIKVHNNVFTSMSSIINHPFLKSQPLFFLTLFSFPLKDGGGENFGDENEKRKLEQMTS